MAEQKIIPESELVEGGFYIDSHKMPDRWMGDHWYWNGAGFKPVARLVPQMSEEEVNATAGAALEERAKAGYTNGQTYLNGYGDGYKDALTRYGCGSPSEKAGDPNNYQAQIAQLCRDMGIGPAPHNLESLRTAMLAAKDGRRQAERERDEAKAKAFDFDAEWTRGKRAIEAAERTFVAQAHRIAELESSGGNRS